MKRLAVYCGSATPEDPIYIETARHVGRTLAERGIGVVYGGGRLGLMGAGFCKRLIATGRSVVGYDLDPARRAEAEALGVALAASPAEVAERANPVCIAVTTTKAVQAVVSGDGGILSAKLKPGTIVIDFSTTEIGVTKALAAALAEAGIGFIDAPVSGGPPAAEAGKRAWPHQHHDADAAERHPRHLAHGQLLVMLEKMGEQDRADRHEGHEDGGEPAVDSRLAPGDEEERQGLTGA